MSKQQKHLNSFSSHVAELLEEYGDIKIKSMFGGYGVFLNEKIIGIIADEELYFKSPKDNLVFKEEYGAEQFAYEAKGKPVKMSYYKAPSEIFDDSTMLKKWGNISRS